MQILGLNTVVSSEVTQKILRLWKLWKAPAAAKSLQLCPTLCDPIDDSPPGSPVPGILQARTLEWVAILLQCMKVKSESEIAQSCLTLSDPMDCSLPGSSIHGIFQARVLEWGAIAFSMKGSRRQQIYLVPCPTHPPKEFVFSIWIKEVSGLKTFLNLGERKKSFMEICMSIYNVYLLASFQKHML